MVRRKKSLLMLGLLLAMLLTTLTTLWALSRHVPDFYRQADVPAGGKRVDFAQMFIGKATDLINTFKEEGDGKSITLFADEINAFFEEDLWRQDAEELEKQGISHPRVCFDSDRIRLAFRYKNFFMNSIISLEMRIWLVPTEMNTFAVEIVKRRAGAMPFPTQALLEEISTMARRRKVEVDWYQHQGNPVALIRVQPDSPRPPMKFVRIDSQPAANGKSGSLTLVIVPNEVAVPGQAQSRPTRSTLPAGIDRKALIQQAQ